MKKHFGLSIAAIVAAAQLGFAQATPDATVKEFSEALKAGDVSRIAALLPASYQKDVAGLVHEFAGRMDNELWNEIRGFVGNASGAVGTKAQLLGELIPEGQKLTVQEKAKRAKVVEELFGAIGAVAKSEVTTLARLKTTDLPTLATNLKALSGKLPEALAAMNPDEKVPDIELIKSTKLEDGKYEVSFKIDDDEDTEKLTQVEGRWVPVEMADEWANGIKEAKEALTKLDFTSPEGQAQKAQMLQFIKILGPVVTQLEKAQTKADIEALGASVLMPLMMMGGSLGL